MKMRGSLCARVLVVFLSVLLLDVSFAVSAAEQDELCYLAIGDSIAKGYSCDDTEIVPYPSLVKDGLEQQGEEVFLVNRGKNGLSTDRFCNTLMEQEEVVSEIREADIITVTIGANDLIDEFKRASQEVLGESERFWNLNDAMEMLNEQMKAHPTLVLKAIAAIASWDYDSFEMSYCKMMEGIAAEAKGSAQIIVTNIYNPTTGLGMPGTLGKVVDGIIGKMNGIIEMHAEEYNYRVVDLVNSDICDYVQVDGLHPTQDGQRLIADMIQPMLQSRSIDETAKEAEAMEKRTQDTRHTSGFVSVAAAVGVGVTGVLLILLGVWKRRK